MYSFTCFAQESPGYSIQKLMKYIADSLTSLDCQDPIRCSYSMLQLTSALIVFEKKIFDLSTINQQLNTLDIIVLDLKLFCLFKLSSSNIQIGVRTAIEFNRDFSRRYSWSVKVAYTVSHQLADNSTQQLVRSISEVSQVTAQKSGTNIWSVLTQKSGTSDQSRKTATHSLAQKTAARLLAQKLGTYIVSRSWSVYCQMADSSTQLLALDLS